MSPIVTAEIVLAVTFGAVLLLVAYVWVRRRIIAGGQPLMACAVSNRHRWRLGLARISSDHLQWFSVVGPSLRPERSWARADLDLGAADQLVDQIPGLPLDAVRVEVRTIRGDDVLALSPGAYTAVRAWIESSPPGFNVNVT